MGKTSPPKRETQGNPVGRVARERRRKNREGGGKQKKEKGASRTGFGPRQDRRAS